MTKEHIGFIGLGIMGKRMALNLLKAGYSMTIRSGSEETRSEFAARGVRVARTPAEVAAESDVIITMLPGSPEVEEVSHGRARHHPDRPDGERLHRHEFDRSGDVGTHRLGTPEERRLHARRPGQRRTGEGEIRHAFDYGRRRQRGLRALPRYPAGDGQGTSSSWEAPGRGRSPSW